ncbi:putative transport protein [subsurface metagenome]
MKNTFGSYIKVSLLILSGISLIWVLYLARGVLWPFALALLLVYLLTPLVDYLTDKELPRVAATFCAYIVLFSIFTLIMLVVIPRLVDAFQEISSQLPQYIDATKKYAASIQEKYRGLRLLLEREELTDWIFQGIGALTGKVAQSIAGVPAGIFLFILSLIVSFYLLKDARKIRSALINYIPKEYQKKVSEFLTDVDKILGGYIRGQLIIAAVVGTSIGIGLFLLRIKYAFVLGTVAGVFNVVPYFGAVIAITPALLLGLIKDPFSAWTFLWVILLFIGVSQVEMYFLAPRILSRKVRLHPVAIIFAIVVGGAALGILGVLLAIPALAILKALFIRLHQRKG